MEKKLYRSSNNVVLAGVCSGIGEHMGIDPTIVRLVVAFLFLGSFGTGAVIYLVASIIIPRNPEHITSSNSSSYQNSTSEVLREKDDQVGEVGETQQMKKESESNKKINLNK